jgi:hypothetical protein
MNADARVIILIVRLCISPRVLIVKDLRRVALEACLYICSVGPCFGVPLCLKTGEVMRPSLIKQIPTQCGAIVRPFSTQNLGSGC